MKSLGRYEILSELGRGAMGVVYLGNDAKIQRQVALKCLRSEIFEASDESRKRFQGEILALGRLIHPNIVTIFDTGEEGDFSYIVMEYVEGTSLSQMLKEGGPLTLHQTVQMGIDICRAIDFAHSKGVIHRDIKPGNIILSSKDQKIKVTDFGIARLDEGAYTRTHDVLGTPQYMSPEQCKGEGVDSRSDLFSIGVILYELLTRQKPFSGNTIAVVMHQIVSQSPVPPRTLSPNIPKSLSDIVMKALEKDPRRRFSTGAEMANALLSLEIKEQTVLETPTVMVGSLGRGSRYRRKVLAAVAAVGIVALMGGLIFAPRKEQPVSIPKESVTPFPVKQTGTVDLTSTPLGAEALINGNREGLTPLVLDLAQGSHDLVLNKEGYYPLEATLTVVAGEKVSVDLNLTEKEEMP